jgi:hypothetical protein
MVPFKLYLFRLLWTWSIKGVEPCCYLALERSWQRSIGSTKHKKTNYVMKKNKNQSIN